MQVRKEYSKCFRHTYCCGGLPTESSHGSAKTSTARTSARYSSGTQVDRQLYTVEAFKPQCNNKNGTQCFLDRRAYKLKQLLRRIYFYRDHVKKKMHILHLSFRDRSRTQTLFHILQAASAALHDYLSSVLPPLALAFIFFSH